MEEDEIQGLSLSIIRRAMEGEPMAMEKVLERFEPYIRSLCTKAYDDGVQKVSYQVDEEMKRRLESELMYAIVANFKFL